MVDRASWEGRHIVIAEFTVPRAHHAAFLEAAVVDARTTVDNEPGARQFDVTVPEDNPDMVVLYEVYEDRAAFDAHLETPHLETFRAAVARYGATSKVVHLTRVHS